MKNAPIISSILPLLVTYALDGHETSGGLGDGGFFRLSALEADTRTNSMNSEMLLVQAMQMMNQQGHSDRVSRQNDDAG